jgi:predicted membrane channel-forming protein YqfA (hemolysin III family)
MDTLLLPFFIVNLALILVDASVGYYLAPVLFRASGGEPEAAVNGARTIRYLLTGVVALYMFFNCLAFFRHNAPLLLVVTGLILFDLGGQLYIRYRTRQRNNLHDQ